MEAHFIFARFNRFYCDIKPAQPYIIKLAIDSHIMKNDYQGLMNLGIVYFLLILVSSVSTYFQNNTLQFTGQYVIYDFRQAIFQHFAKMEMSFYRAKPDW
ncbi:ABC transporter transmembrane domain-containing protein [Neobacillus cucumis]|uniref:ABC transporter transmembrane domain-containing protein n=1 Tax=Neobacillus cucumis TaxID=1740721 RepID=UPI00285357CB|nr:ABC transporter transmembrane domain-containing protein [Neobacillus cucumis]MDR4947759.1 ABC transporter transmembrane domain-containing protein [Neobacillus cucumis]